MNIIKVSVHTLVIVISWIAVTNALDHFDLIFDSPNQICASCCLNRRCARCILSADTDMDNKNNDHDYCYAHEVSQPANKQKELDFNNAFLCRC
jgi:hypothetical protein